MTKKLRIWGLVQDRLSPAIVTHAKESPNADDGWWLLTIAALKELSTPTWTPPVKKEV